MREANGHASDSIRESREGESQPALDVDAQASYNNAATRKLVRERLFKAGIRLRAVLQLL